MYHLAAFGVVFIVHDPFAAWAPRLVTRSLACVRFFDPWADPNPEYYRQTPPKVPNFYATLFRRKLVLWFLLSLVLRDYWLSGVSVTKFSVPLVSNLSFPVLRKELVILVGQRAQGLASPHPDRRLLHRCLGRPPCNPHLDQQGSHVVPCHLRSRHRRSTLVSSE